MVFVLDIDDALVDVEGLEEGCFKDGEDTSSFFLSRFRVSCFERAFRFSVVAATVFLPETDTDSFADNEDLLWLDFFTRCGNGGVFLVALLL